jgi:Asp-tRNA(Asn)/Glu-tRNA(Gln) amidotransferase A subunit family amidase
LFVLREAGASVDVLEIAGEFDGAHKIHRTIMLFEAARLARKAREVWRGGFSDFLNKALDEGENMRDADYREALKLRTQLQQSLAEFFDRGYSAVITPPAAGEAPATLENTGDPRFCTIWTLVGHPAITIPTGKARARHAARAANHRCREEEKLPPRHRRLVRTLFPVHGIGLGLNLIATAASAVSVIP